MLYCRVSIANVAEVMDVLDLQKGPGGEGVYRRIPPALHPETPASVHHLKESLILFAAKPTQFGNLKVRPEMACVVRFAFHGLGIILGPEVFALLLHLLRRTWVRICGLIRLYFDGLDKHLPQVGG